MPAIDLDTLEAFTEAVVRNHDDVTPRELVGMLRYLDDNALRISRKPEPLPIEPAPMPPELPALPFVRPDGVPDEIPF